MRLVMLSGGVGGARMARGLATLPKAGITLVVNVADDDLVHGLYVSADLDTVVYTLAGLEGPAGWGRSSESWQVMDEMERLPGADTSFRLGDRDLATNLYRTGRLASGHQLDEITADICSGFGVEVPVLPATNDRVRTMVTTDVGEIDFQTYFVRRQHRDPILGLRFVGATEARPAPGVLDAITQADLILLGPSNPVLSIWPILAIPGVEDALARAPAVAVVSPLISGRALKGPAVDAMRSAGLAPDIGGVVEAYRGLVTHLVIDSTETGTPPGDVAVMRTNTLISEPTAAAVLATEIVEWLS